MRAATVDAIFVPRHRVHEWLDKKPEGVRLIQFKLPQQFAQRLRLTAAFHKVLQFISYLGAQKLLYVFEVDEIADGTDLARDFEQVADRRAIRVAAAKRRK